MSRTTALQARWKALAPREQNLVLAAGGIVALALVWWVAPAPALATLRQAPELHRKLDLQLQHMQRLQAEAQQLQAQPQTSPSDAVGALRTALTQRLGHRREMNVLGDRVTVTLKAAPAEATAEWLALARTNARAVTVEARPTRSNATAPSNAGPGHTGQRRRPCRPTLGRHGGAGPARPLISHSPSQRPTPCSTAPGSSPRSADAALRGKARSRSRTLPMTAARAPWGWAVAGALAGVLPAIVAFAPAQWLTQRLGGPPRADRCN